MSGSDEPAVADDGQRDRDGEVPRLPRGKHLKASGPAVFRIGMIAILLVAVIGMRKPCGEGIARFIGTFEPPKDAGPEPAATPPMQLERLTEEEIRRRFPGGDELPAPDAGPAAAPATPAPAVPAPAAPAPAVPTPPSR